MSIRGSQILHDVNGYVVDRIQTAGPGSLNIPEEKVYELGNFETLATVRDIPDLSFSLQSFDVSCEFEALLLGKNPTTLTANQELDFVNHVPIDVISPFKSRRGAFDIVKGVAVPYLTLERASYTYGLRQNASQEFSLKGDSIYYTQGQPYYKEFTLAGAGSTYAFGMTADVYTEGADSVYALCVTLVDSTTGAYKRLFHDAGGTTGYSNTATQVTIAQNHTADYDTVRIVWSSSATMGSYTQLGNNPNSHPVHQNVSVKPAAVRPKDIDVYIGTAAATPVWSRLNSVQSAQVDWSVQLENDEEFGNKHYVVSDYDVPEVTGQIGIKPFDPADLFYKLSQITGVPSTEVIGPELTTPVPIEVRINHPDTGARLKTIYVPDARFQVPGLQGRVQSKLENTFSFTSDTGVMKVLNGNGPGGAN